MGQHSNDLLVRGWDEGDSSGESLATRIEREAREAEEAERAAALAARTPEEVAADDAAKAERAAAYAAYFAPAAVAARRAAAIRNNDCPDCEKTGQPCWLDKTGRRWVWDGYASHQCVDDD